MGKKILPIDTVHSPYQPARMPPDALNSSELIHLASVASAELAKYNTLLTLLPNPDIVLRSLQTEEAVLSSKIEGTQATFDEVLRHDAGEKVKDENKCGDFQEITNYREALSQGREVLNKGHKINLAFVRELHKILMNSERGANKDPGTIRKVQNYVGSHVPPDAGQLPIHMKDWLAYLNNDGQEPLIQTALMYAQFELLHPFLGGNGRLGRILIPLFLWQKKRTSAPIFYISAYLESNRAAYYERLRNISDHGDWTGWVRFFLEAMAAQAKTNNEKIDKIKSLYEEIKGENQKITHSQFINNILSAIFTNPYPNQKAFVRNGIPQSSAYHLLRFLKKNRILTIIGIPLSSNSAKIYKFHRLVDILHNK